MSLMHFIRLSQPYRTWKLDNAVHDKPHVKEKYWRLQRWTCWNVAASDISPDQTSDCGVPPVHIPFKTHC